MGDTMYICLWRVLVQRPKRRPLKDFFTDEEDSVLESASLLAVHFGHIRPDIPTHTRTHTHTTI